MSEKVIVIISGGCADVLTKHDNIELEIRDYDVETIDAESDDRCKKDKDGDWYQEMIFPANDEDTNNHIEILQHDISYYFADGSILEHGVGDAEHIEYMISSGFSEGKLGTDGYWKIVK